MITNPESFADDDSKHSDRVCDAVRKLFPGTQGIRTNVVAYTDCPTLEVRASKIIKRAGEQGCDTIVVYRDNLGQERVTDALLEQLKTEPEPPQVIRRVGSSYDFVVVT